MSLKLRTLKLAARRPLLALAIAVAVPAAIGAAVVARHPTEAKNTEALAGNPRAILGRVWFDKYPQKRTEDVKIFIWLAGGIGIHEAGSSYKSTFELFDFERQGDKVVMTFLQDKSKAETKFTVTQCDDEPPFDLCLDLANTPRGPKRYYGFGDIDDMDANVPWARSVLRAAEDRSVPGR